MEDLIHWMKMAGVVALPFIGNSIVGMFSPIDEKAVNWYKGLVKPSWTPPMWIFPIAWTSFLFSMGGASYLVWKDGGGLETDSQALVPLSLYGTHLVLMWAFCPIYYGKHNLPLAFVDSMAMLGTAGACAYTFHPINKFASYLMIPYVAWMAMETGLNYRNWMDNPCTITEEKKSS